MAGSQQTKSQRSRKLKALLAGGVVLGVGAAVTLAAWTDQEWVSGLFEAGTFNLQGSTDGTNFADHGTEAIAMPLEAEAFGNLSPGASVVAPYYLQLTDSTYDATVGLTEANPEDGLAGLSYDLVVQPAGAADCSDTSAGTALATGEALGSFPAVPVEFTLQPGVPALLCFTFAAGVELVQGSSVDATWQFTATSVDA